MVKIFRPRYMYIKIVAEDKNILNDISSHEILNLIRRSMHNLFGEYVLAKSPIQVIDFNPENATVILRTTHKALPYVRCSILFITNIKGVKAAFHTLYVSGTIKRLKAKIQDRDEKINQLPD